MTKQELTHLTEMAQAIWELLTEDEQKAFCVDTGTIGFVEKVADLLHIDISTMTLDELDELLATLDK